MPALRMQRRKDHELEASLCYKASPLWTIQQLDEKTANTSISLSLLIFSQGPSLLHLSDDLLEPIVFVFGPSFKCVLFNIITSAI